MISKLSATPGSLAGASLTTRFRRAAGFVPAGVAILSTPDVAMTVSSLHCVSFSPPLVSVALGKDSRKAQVILASGQFHVRLLRGGEADVARGQGIPDGAGMVEMECKIAASYPVGDHHLLIASVGDVRLANHYPLVSWRRGLHEFRPHYDFLCSRETFQEFVRAWETGALPKNRWTHAGHVAIGAYYAVGYPDEAFARTKRGILRYNEAVGTENSPTSGYHETLTRLWANLLARLVDGFTDPWKAACQAVDTFGEDRDLHRLYYSFDVARSLEARRTWVPPDLEGPYGGGSG
jgi:flavin reductase (DIM6/NTAB) family NADH-FMN oxidoreductase RutF